jgi:cyclophilin family peptidyl-prolyl cis-trans isomerase
MRLAQTPTAVVLLVCGLLAALACQAEGGEEKEQSVTPSGAAGGIPEIEAFIAKQTIDKTGAGWKTKLPKPPQVAFPSGAKIRWVLETNLGKIGVDLMPDVAPMHVTSTVYLTKLGFYDGVVFHRVIPGFMAQGGDPTGTGRGGPGYTYGGEFDANVKHDRGGLLSMANAGPNTDGSQFFLTFVATPWLDGKHTIFGSVALGMDVVKELEKRGTRGGQPTEKLEIVRATIE